MKHFLISILFLSPFLGMAQQLSDKEVSYLQKKTIGLPPPSKTTSTDWSFMDKQLKGKTLVALGEFNHGSKEVVELRNSLIKYLHEEQGFNVVLFESGIGEVGYYDLKSQELSSRRFLNSLIWSWRSKGFYDLMTYIKSKNMRMGGFDVQRTGGSFKLLLQELSTTLQIDSPAVYKLEAQFGNLKMRLRRQLRNGTTEAETKTLISQYQHFIDLLQLKSTSSNVKGIPLAIQTIKNRISYLKYVLEFAKNKAYPSYWEARDRAMAANVIWLKENLFKDEKIIIVGHNFHIAKENPSLLVMGKLLKDKYQEEFFTIGTFAASGTFANNARDPEPITKVITYALDIKHIIAILPSSYSYLPIPKSAKKINLWLFKPIVVHDTFIDLNKNSDLVLADHFDALFLLKEVSVPDYDY